MRRRASVAALTIVISTGEFDLSVGYGVGLLYVLAVGLIVKQDVPWPLAIVIVLCAGLVFATYQNAGVRAFRSAVQVLGGGLIR